MKYSRIFILLLILISSFFILQVIKDKETIDDIAKLTTKSILSLTSKASSVSATISVQVDDGAPRIFIDSPLNKTYNFNNSIELNFTIVEDNLGTTYYNIDDGANTTVTANTTFSVNETIMSHKLTLFANDTLGNLNSSSVRFVVNISGPWNVTFTEFTGGTTNFSALNKTQQANIANAIVENPSHAKIAFNEVVNISRDINLDSFSNISFNRVEINSSFISEFNKSALIYLYNITFANPRPLRDSSVCPSSICTEINFSGNTFVFNVTSFTVYSSEETPAEAAPSPGAPGGGAGGGRGVSALTDFSISANLIKVALLQGETKIEFIEIENIGTSALNLEIDLEGIKDFLIFPGGVGKYILRLQPGEKQTLQLIFSAAKDYKPGVYPGRIIIRSPIVQKIITTIVEVESSKKIFDVDIRIQEKKVVKGTNLVAEIIIFNLGQSIGRVDTQVEFGIKDLDGNIIQTEEIRLAVETQASFTESILVPKYLEDGRYVFYAIVTFDNETGAASEIFEVISRPAGFLALSTLYIYIIPGFILIIIILIILFELKHHYKKKLGLIPRKVSFITKIKEKFNKRKL